MKGGVDFSQSTDGEQAFLKQLYGCDSDYADVCWQADTNGVGCWESGQMAETVWKQEDRPHHSNHQDVGRPNEDKALTLCSSSEPFWRFVPAGWLALVQLEPGYIYYSCLTAVASSLVKAWAMEDVTWFTKGAHHIHRILCLYCAGLCGDCGFIRWALVQVADSGEEPRKSWKASIQAL